MVLVPELKAYKGKEEKMAKGGEIHARCLFRPAEFPG